MFANASTFLSCSENLGHPQSAGLMRGLCIQSLKRRTLLNLCNLLISHETVHYIKVEHSANHSRDASLWTAKADLRILYIETIKLYDERQLAPTATS